MKVVDFPFRVQGNKNSQLIEIENQARFARV